MNARDALIEDILAWAPPPRERAQEARDRLEHKTEEELDARHRRLELLEEWASQELADLPLDVVAARSRQVENDDRFAADLLAAIRENADVAGVLERHRLSSREPGIIAGDVAREVEPKGDPFNPIQERRLGRPARSIEQFSELCLPIICRAFPRSLNLGSAFPEISLVLQQRGGSVGFCAVQLSWKLAGVELICRFDLLARSVVLEIPDFGLLHKGELAVAFEAKRHEIESQLEPLLAQADWPAIVRNCSA